MSEWRAQAVFRLAGQALSVSKDTVELTLRHRLPSMLLVKEEVAAGALISYDADRAELFRRSAYFVDKILKGAKLCLRLQRGAACGAGGVMSWGRGRGEGARGR